MSRRRLAIRYGGPLVYAAALAVYCVREGVPFARDPMLAWIGLGLLAFSLADIRGFFRSLVVEWLPFAAILVAYDLGRGVADDLGIAPHVWPQISVDRVIGGGTLPTLWLQAHLWHGPADLHWWDYATWVVYVSHFFVTLVAAAVLWVVARPLFRRFLAMVVVLAGLGLATYALFPAVPPWLAAQRGDIAPVAPMMGEIFHRVGGADFESLFEHGREWSNQVAAMPSLHAAEALLVALFFWRVAPRWHVLLAAYPPAMGFALVYSGEHYAIDVVVGWVYAVAAFVVVELASARLPERDVVAAPQRLVNT